MQTRYIGDVGDFGKFGLLRALAGQFPSAAPRLSLGVVWYLVSRHEANNDGMHDGYLNLKSRAAHERVARSFRECDPDLYSELREIRTRRRFVMADIQESKLFAGDTKFYDTTLSFEQLPWEGPATKEARLTHRNDWLEKSLAAVQGCQVVFVDPDNGLEVDSVPRHGMDGPKYVFFDELRKFTDRGQSLVIYHHLNMHSDHPSQIKFRVEALGNELSLGRQPIALRYHRGSGRVFLIVPCSDEHEKLFTERVTAFVTGPWGRNGHFTLARAATMTGHRSQ